jgi:hypothetical protein
MGACCSRSRVRLAEAMGALRVHDPSAAAALEARWDAEDAAVAERAARESAVHAERRADARRRSDLYA